MHRNVDFLKRTKEENGNEKHPENNAHCEREKWKIAVIDFHTYHTANSDQSASTSVLEFLNSVSKKSPILAKDFDAPKIVSLELTAQQIL
jgi:hypothetical protein